MGVQGMGWVVGVQESGLCPGGCPGIEESGVMTGLAVAPVCGTKLRVAARRFCRWRTMGKDHTFSRSHGASGRKPESPS